MKPPRSASRKVPYKIVITEVKDENGDGRVDLADVEWLIRNNANLDIQKRHEHFGKLKRRS